MLQILNAAAGGVVLDKGFQLDGTGGIAGITRIGMDPSYADFLFGDRRERGLNPCLVAMMSQSPDEGVTSSRDDLLREWTRSVYFNECAKPEGFSHMLCSTRTLGVSHVVDGFAFWRATGDHAFTDEDQAIIRILQHECPPFFADLEVPLSPRARATLEHLLRGASDKEIAAHLTLSPHTVHQYIKTIYRAYGVHSRWELISLFRGRRSQS